jgi:methylated-DNA-[protein]-cysteine S-methyltransferase
MKLEGTDFQIKVWNELNKIPSGETKTYKEIAKILGNPKAARAVANACARNPHPIIIPCHRVVRSDGGLGGYSGEGGVEKKRQLLENEKISNK